MLEVEAVSSGYGDVSVLHGLSLSVRKGQIVAVLGANGAGKSTLLNTISGLVPVRGGRILFEGEPIERLAPETIVDRGISQVPQGRRIFPGLTVEENLKVARTRATDRAAGGFEAAVAEVYKVFPRLDERRGQLGWSLSGGEQQMLAVGRALVARAKLVLLDEPSLGLAPIIVTELFDAIAEICRREAMTALLVEQNARQAMRIANFVYLIELGRVLTADTPAALERNERVARAYLGG